MAHSYQWFHFAIRERMAKQNTNADNHVMWRGPVQAPRAWDVFTKWVAAATADRSNATQRDKVVRNRPAEAVDGCWVEAAGKPAEFIAERQTFSRRPDSKCNTAYPSSSFVRQVAGGPLDANVLKCEMKPIDAKDFAAPFTTAELQRLRAIFPGGVCDWSKPGVNQTRVVPWASFGPAPENLLFEVARQKTLSDLDR